MTAWTTVTDGLTIGQAAAYAGVTIKTVRHYHRLGLVGEPDRDGSGYRRYGSADLLRLVRVRTLAAAGVPLAEIGGLLDADPGRFAAAVDDVEQRLTERIEELVARRAMLRRLADGDRLLLPDRASTALDRVTAAGFDDGYVAALRESLVLSHALLPEIFERHLSQIDRQLDDPAYAELMKRSWEAMSWDPDDPRLTGIAADMAARLLADPSLLTVPAEFRARPDGAVRYGLINHHGGDRDSTAARLTALVEAHLRGAGIEVPRQ